MDHAPRPATPTANRRMMLLLGGSALAAAACGDGEAGKGPPVQLIPTPGLVAITRLGPVSGTSDGGVVEFRGLRYARPPVGALRFQPPVAPEPWSEPVQAIRYGEAAMQLRAVASGVSYPPEVLKALQQAFLPPDYISAAGSEDCLTLNVYTPSADGKRRPVMVWLHGGGFAYGQSALNIYRGRNLAARQDVVVVGVNHRLNIFGFLALAGEGVPGFEQTSNVGMLDIIAALRWVRDNIDQFGGDPGNVTIFGQSGGGAKVATLMAMPAAAGLFHKAIIQSGAQLKANEPEDARNTARQVLEALGASAEDPSPLLTATPERLVEVAREIGAKAFAPSIDPATLPAHPFEPAAPEMCANIPLLVGFTRDEQTLYVAGDPDWPATTEAQVLAQAREMSRPHARALVAAYRERFPDYSPPYLKTQVSGTTRALVAAHTLASRKAAQPAPVFSYLFAHDLPPAGGLLKAAHTAEIPYVFDTVEQAPLFAGATEADLAMGRMVSTMWANFARTGSPNGTGLPEWPRFDAETRATLVISGSPVVEMKPYDAVWTLMGGAGG